MRGNKPKWLFVSHWAYDEPFASVSTQPLLPDAKRELNRMHMSTAHPDREKEWYLDMVIDLENPEAVIEGYDWESGALLLGSRRSIRQQLTELQNRPLLGEADDEDI